MENLSSLIDKFDRLQQVGERLSKIDSYLVRARPEYDRLMMWKQIFSKQAELVDLMIHMETKE